MASDIYSHIALVNVNILYSKSGTNFRNTLPISTFISFIAKFCPMQFLATRV